MTLTAKTQEEESLRVLFLVSEYDRFHGGQQSLLQLLRGLPAAGIEPLVFFPKEGRCSRAYREAGVPVGIFAGPKMLTEYGQHLLRMSRFRTLWIFLTQMLPYSYRIAREMRRRGILIVHCNSVRSLLFAGFVPFLLRYRIVWHVRGQLLPFGRAVRVAAQFLATSIILVARALRQEIEPRFQHKCRTIYNGIDENAVAECQLQPAALPFTAEDGQPIISTFAAVTPFKGYHHLLEAVRLVNKQSFPKRPIFLGVGELFDQEYVSYLRKLSHEYELDNFYFLGWQQNPFPFYRLADVVVLPTVEQEQLSIGDVVIDVRSGEGLPRTVLEAMYFGKPTIATTVAGTVEQIIEGETGLLVPPADPEALARAIILLLKSSPAVRQEMGRKAALRVRETFSTERTVRETVALYRELLGPTS